MKRIKMISPNKKGEIYVIPQKVKEMQDKGFTLERKYKQSKEDK